MFLSYWTCRRYRPWVFPSMKMYFFSLKDSNKSCNIFLQNMTFSLTNWGRWSSLGSSIGKVGCSGGTKVRVDFKGFFSNLPVVSSKANLLWPVKCLLYAHHVYYFLARHFGGLQIKFFLIQRPPLLKGLHWNF